MTGEDRGVSVEAIKCASMVFTRVEVTMLLIYLEDFLKQIIELNAAKRNLMPAKELFGDILAAAGVCKISDKLLKIY